MIYAISLIIAVIVTAFTYIVIRCSEAEADLRAAQFSLDSYKARASYLEKQVKGLAERVRSLREGKQ